MELKMVQPWSIHPFYPFLSLALHTSWFGASWWASWAATPSAETFSCQGEKEWKRMKKNHLIWTIYNGFYEFLWTAHHAMNKNIIHEYGWIWVVDRVVHYMLLWSIMEILLPISTKWLLTSRVPTKWIQLEHRGISSIIMYCLVWNYVD